MSVLTTDGRSESRIMKNWISRLFGGAEQKPEPVASPAPGAKKPRPREGEPKPVPSAEVAHTLRIHHAADVNTLFFRWMIEQHEKTPLQASEFEKKVLEALDALSKSEMGGANLVPRVPAVIPQLLKSLRDENISALDLARQISHDIVLVAEVIHEANSPFYRPAKPIHNIENAVMVLGQNGLRLVIARVAFRPLISMQTGRYAKMVAPKIWAQSEKCAEACKILAHTMRADPFLAFLAGLIQNVGIIVAFRLIDRGYQGNVLPDSDHFCHAFQRFSRLLSARIAEQWEFPEQVSTALTRLAHGEWSGLPLEHVLFLSDQMGKLRLLVEHKLLQEDEYFTTNGMTAREIECFEKLKEQTGHV